MSHVCNPKNRIIYNFLHVTRINPPINKLESNYRHRLFVVNQLSIEGTSSLPACLFNP